MDTILTTHTNTDNHPAIIKTTGRLVRTKQRIELHKQFKVPLDGLMAEEIDLSKKKKGDNGSAKDGPFQKVQEDESESASSGDEKDDSKAAEEPITESEKAARKKA